MKIKSNLMMKIKSQNGTNRSKWNIQYLVVGEHISWLDKKFFNKIKKKFDNGGLETSLRKIKNLRTKLKNKINIKRIDRMT